MIVIGGVEEVNEVDDAERYKIYVSKSVIICSVMQLVG